VIGVISLVAERFHPFAYLGYMYVGEASTPVLAERVLGFLRAREFPEDANRFVALHATADVGHARLLRQLIVEVVNEYPEAADAIGHAFDCFTCVYPLPVWTAAFRAARREEGIE
jgi:hypothetical protein